MTRYIWQSSARTRRTIIFFSFVATAFIRILLIQFSGDMLSFAPFLIPVVVSSLAGGFAAGLAATAIGAFAADFFFIQPVFAFSALNEHLIIRIAMFLFEGVTFSWLCGTLRDLLFEKGRLLEDGRRAQRAAEEANQAKSRFLANISHEMRTPLTAILGFTELMIYDELTPNVQRESLKTILRNGHILSRVIDDILDLSKVESGKMEIEQIDCDLVQVLHDVFYLLEPIAQRKGIALASTLSPSVPQYISTDPVRLRQILLNLIGNGLKFTDRGSVQLDVECIPVRGESDEVVTLRFAVHDSGIGLTSEQADRLFHPFSQADSSTTRQYGGTGLGLVLSKKLARLLGGDLELMQTLPGEGSTFTFTIQAKGALSSVSPKLDESIASLPPRGELQGIRVLVVEDSADNRTLLARILGTLGANVTTASDGQEGVERALENSHDIVLMDIQMPRMDGMEALLTLRNRGYRKPIVALTAHAMREDRQRCLDIGFSDHLAKPIQRQEMVRVILRQFAQPETATLTNF